MSAMTSTTSMTAIDYAALAERLKEHAALHDSLAAHSDEQRVWADDLRTLEAMVRGMAKQESVRAVPFDVADRALCHVGMANYAERQQEAEGWLQNAEFEAFTHPAPQPQPEPIDPHMIAAEDRYPDEPTEAQIEQHPDDAAVDRFAAAMKAKLAEKRDEGRGGWDDPEQCSTTYLATLLRGHVEKGDPLDVGNFAMMLWNRGGATNEAVDPGIPDLRLTEAQITAAAKELCQCHAEGRGADPDDEWKAYCEQFRTEAARVLRAALAAKEPK